MSYKLGGKKQLTNDRYLPWRLQKAPSCPKKNGPPQAISCRTTAKLPAYRHAMISRQSLKLTAKDPEKIGHTKQNFIFQPTIFKVYISFREGTPPKTNNPKQWRWMVQFPAVSFRLEYHTEHPLTQRLLLVEAEFTCAFSEKLVVLGNALGINYSKQSDSSHFLPCCDKVR